jgi:hypothetical protein
VRWAVVLVATAMSTLNDLIATGSGVLLAASPALDGTSQGVVVGFLAATNLGAAAYEYGVARLSHLFLVRRSRPVARGTAEASTRSMNHMDGLVVVAGVKMHRRAPLTDHRRSRST